MPVDLTETELRDVLAQMGEHDLAAAADARMALESCGWDGGDLLLSRFAVQVLAWSIVPRKVAAPIDTMVVILEGFAQLLDRLPDPAPTYASICRSDETLRLLREWDEDPGSASEHLARLMVESGIEPPDCEVLRWRHLMGPVETAARIDAGVELERAIEEGRLDAGASEAERAALTAAFLRAPALSGTRLAAIEAERIDGWLGGHYGDSATREELLAPVLALFEDPPPLELAAARTALEPALWLLGCAAEGIRLTQTGALSRAFVREAAERYPGWWEAEIHGLPYRETDVTQLSVLHEELRAARLVRRHSGKLRATKRGKELAADPVGLLEHLGDRLLDGPDFEAAAAELAAALVLDGARLTFGEKGYAQLALALSEDGWSGAEGEPISARDASWAAAQFLHRARVIGVLVQAPLRPDQRPWETAYEVSEAGRGALVRALHRHATGPH